MDARKSNPPGIGHAAPATPRGERLGRAVTIGFLLVSLTSLMIGLASCRRNVLPYSSPRRDLAIASAPIIRVRITSAGSRRAEIMTTGSWTITDLRGRILAAGGDALGPVTVRRSAAAWHVGGRTLRGEGLILKTTQAAAVVGAGNLYYRGVLHLLAARDGGLTVVNHVNLEDYLKGVLASELYRDWHLEAYRAQAVAARTFALYNLITSNRRSNHDLTNTQRSQVYEGLKSETEKSALAVESTRGMILAAGRPGDERIFMSQYSACCGGRVNPVGIFGKSSSLEPLQGGQICDHCRAFPRRRWPTVVVPNREIHAALAAKFSKARRLRDIDTLRVVEATAWGRPIRIEAVASNGKSVVLRAEDVRIALTARKRSIPQATNLLSMNCRIRDRGRSIAFEDGKGFGHGVGLCQWGAQGQAARGRTGEQILEFYYPGSRLFRAY